MPTPCQTTAFATLLTVHSNTSTSTYLSHVDHTKAARMIQLVRTLARSVRRFEQCRPHRDFLLLAHGIWPGTVERLSEQENLKLHWLKKPIVRGVPSADKLEAWRFTQYEFILFVDADMMFVAPPDTLFQRAAYLGVEHYGANHPYEMVQAGCGVPIEQRAVGGLFVLRPFVQTYWELLAHLHTYTEHHLQHYSEQTALACFFRGRNTSATMGCAALFDLAGPMAQRNPEVLLKQSEKNCRFHALANMKRSWPHASPRKLQAWAGRGACAATMRHNGACGKWDGKAAVAVHFKGKYKPWLFLSRGMRAKNLCAPLKHGMLRTVLTGRMLTLTNSTLRWDDATQTCVEAESGVPVRWAPSPYKKDSPIVPKQCCDLRTLMAADWYNLLRRKGVCGEFSCSGKLLSDGRPRRKLSSS